MCGSLTGAVAASVTPLSAMSATIAAAAVKIVLPCRRNIGILFSCLLGTKSKQSTSHPNSGHTRTNRTENDVFGWAVVCALRSTGAALLSGYGDDLVCRSDHSGAGRRADHGLAFLVRGGRQQSRDGPGAVLVLPGGRLVDDQQPPRTRERPGQRQALGFAGRKPVHTLAGPVGQPGPGPPPPPAPRGGAGGPTRRPPTRA